MKGKKRKKFFILNLFFACIIISILFWTITEEYDEQTIKEKEEQVMDITKLSTMENETSIKPIQTKQYPKETVTTKYKGYAVAAKLEIPSIKLETYILEENSSKALNVAVTKFWGATPNEIGNLCVAGHNAPNKNMFRKLKKLKIGNNLFIIDNTIGRIEYEIYNTYKVYPEDVSCLTQQTDGKREVTLITCTNDSKQRTIIKAKEKES